MDAPKYPMEASCRCGQVKVSIASPPVCSMVCHCKGCQKMTAGPYSMSLMMAPDSFSVLEGEPVLGGLKAHIQHYFCPGCMSWVYTRIPGRETFLVRTTLLERPDLFPPFMESNTLEKLPWVSTPAVHSFEKFPAPEDYKQLMADYAEHAKKSNEKVEEELGTKS